MMMRLQNGSGSTDNIGTETNTKSNICSAGNAA